jgi:hypothetical protein
MHKEYSRLGHTVICKTGPAEQHCGYEKAKQILSYDNLASMASYRLTQERVSSKCTKEAARAAE